MILVADPGLHHVGVSLWTPEGRLVRAELVKNPFTMSGPLNAGPMAQAVFAWASAHADEVTEVVVEIPQVYARERSKGDPNDLIDLACVVGAILGLFQAPRSTVYRPAQWKGTVPKEITTMRAKATLSQEEQNTIVICQPASLMHNVWDSVALGLAHLKKTNRRPK